jgi:hypothetical protein
VVWHDAKHKELLCTQEKTQQEKRIYFHSKDFKEFISSRDLNTLIDTFQKLRDELAWNVPLACKIDCC